MRAVHHEDRGLRGSGAFLSCLTQNVESCKDVVVLSSNLLGLPIVTVLRHLLSESGVLLIFIETKGASIRLDLIG